MKFDIYYTRKHDSTYEELITRLNGGETSNFAINTLSPDGAYDRLDSYNTQFATFSSPEMLTDFLFALHSVDNDQVERECPFDTVILPHLEKDTLVLNLETHEIRRVKNVNQMCIEVYNNDDLHSSAQEWGYVRIIKEEWNRSKCIPIDMENVDYSSIGSFYYGSPLGVHPKYNKVAFEDMCEW